MSEANPQKKRNVQEETEEATSDDVSPRKGKSKGKGKEKRQRKGRGLATIAVSKDTLHESVQLLKGKERARTGSRRNSGRSTTLASSRSSGTTGGQEIRKASAKALTNLVEKEVCPS